MLDTLMSLVAPHNCRSCGHQGALLCEQCKFDIISEPPTACLFCFKPAPGSNLCTDCRQRTGVEEAWYVAQRSGGVKKLLDDYKFHSAVSASTVIAELFHARLPLLDGLTLTTAPTPPAHRRVRGFDHAKRVGRQLSRLRGLEYRELLRRNSSDAQHFKTRAERLASAEKTIESVGTAPDTVLLIDDILTTGATVAACVRRLKESGTKTVYVAIFARQPYRK